MSLFSNARSIVSATTRHSDLALVGLLVAVIALIAGAYMYRRMRRAKGGKAEDSAEA